MSFESFWSFPGGRRIVFPHAPDRFPATRRSVLLAARDADPEVRRQALDTLIDSYWNEGDEAQDLTQSFFALALEKGTFDRYDPARARFLTFLRLVLDGFVTNERKAARREKRGGWGRPSPGEGGGEAGEGTGVRAPATAHGTILGTPGYMAPEQERGEVERIDERTDVYALGAILSFLLEGEERVPRPLQAIRTRAMAAEPEGRYASVRELTADLGGTLAFWVAYMQGKYYLEIMLPGCILGLVVGYATQRYGGRRSSAAAA